MIKVSVDGLQTPLCERGVAKNEVTSALESMGSALSALEKLREAGEVGFLDLPGKLDDSARCIEVGDRLGDLSETLVVLGIGGSSLGGKPCWTVVVSLVVSAGWYSSIMSTHPQLRRVSQSSNQRRSA